MLESILIFDIETIPDTEVCFQLTEEESTDFWTQKRAMEEYHLAITGGENSFLRQIFHKVVVLSFLKVKITKVNGYEFYSVDSLDSKSIENYSEMEIIKSFMAYWGKEKPRIITFNGRTFDIPVLKFRAMKYNISVRELYTSGDRWNNYFNRYSLDWNIDLLDLLSDNGSSARVKMSEVCIAFKLPGKVGISGKDVAQYYHENRVKEIANYCETDVLNSYLIYLKIAFHQGKIDKMCYNKNIDQLVEIMESREYLSDFYSEWMRLNDGNLHIN